MINSDLSRSATLRASLEQGTLAVPGAFNAFSARLIEESGMPAVYVSGAGLSASRGLPDIGLLSLEEVTEETRRICQAVRIPVIVDADTGFGDVEQVRRTVQALEAAGVSGIQLEDQVFPKRCGHLSGKQIVNCQEMCDKIAAAVSAKHDRDLLIIARTDARAIEGIEGAIERAKAYQAVGADAIFPEALESVEEFERFAMSFRMARIPLMANMTEWGKTPMLSVHEFSQLGYHIVLFPMTMFRMMAKSMEMGLMELQSRGTQKELLDLMQPRSELYRVLRYETYDELNGIKKERQVLHVDDES